MDIPVFIPSVVLKPCPAVEWIQKRRVLLIVQKGLSSQKSSSLVGRAGQSHTFHKPPERLALRLHLRDVSRLECCKARAIFSPTIAAYYPPLHETSHLQNYEVVGMYKPQAPTNQRLRMLSPSEACCWDSCFLCHLPDVPPAYVEVEHGIWGTPEYTILALWGESSGLFCCFFVLLLLAVIWMCKKLATFFKKE